MGDQEYTMEDLEQATGFSKRQIRFYITKKLIPGAGDSRGPNAVYSDETMTKLRAIAHLKDMSVPPTGRKMTLEEIGHALATLSNFELDAMVSGVASLRAVDTREDLAARKLLGELKTKATDDDQTEQSSASDYLASIRPDLERTGRRRPRSAPRGAPDALRVGSSGTHGALSDLWLSAAASDSPEQDLQSLLSHLHSLLRKLGKDSRYIAPEGMDQWQRVTNADIEIHIKQPNDHRAKARLAAMARELARILNGEDER